MRDRIMGGPYEFVNGWESRSGPRRHDPVLSGVPRCWPSPGVTSHDGWSDSSDTGRFVGKRDMIRADNLEVADVLAVGQTDDGDGDARGHGHQIMPYEDVGVERTFLDEMGRIAGPIGAQ
jgi:hypothetical protein